MHCHASTHCGIKPFLKLPSSSDDLKFALLREVDHSRSHSILSFYLRLLWSSLDPTTIKHKISLGRQYTEIQQERLPGAKAVLNMQDYIWGNVLRKYCQNSLQWKDNKRIKIIVDGALDVGKSTLSRNMCKDWGSEEIAAAVVPSGNLKSIREATSIWRPQLLCWWCRSETTGCSTPI